MAGKYKKCPRCELNYILVDEDAVSRLQNRMSLSHLTVEDTALRRSDFTVGMPVHGPGTVWQIGKLVAVKGGGEIQDVVRNLFLQLMVNGYRHICSFTHR